MKNPLKAIITSMAAMVLAIMVIVSAPNAFAVASADWVPVNIEALCPATHLDGINYANAGSETYVTCYSVALGTLVNIVADGTAGGRTIRAHTHCPVNQVRRVVVTYAALPQRVVAWCGDGFGDNTTTSGSIYRVPASLDTAALILMIANIFVFLLGLGFGWKIAARPPIELLN